MNPVKLYRPYSTKSFEWTGSVFNAFYYYVYKHDDHPNVFETKLTLKKETIDRVSKFSKLIFEHKVEKKELESVLVKNAELIYEYDDAIIMFSLTRDPIVLNFMYDDPDDFEEKKQEEKIPQYACRVLYKKEETLNKIIEEFVRIEEKKRKNIFLLCKSIEGFYTRRFDVSLPKVDIDLHYNDGTKEKFDKIIQTLKQDKSGLLLFSGNPGTGKSTFVKYITSQIDKKVIYLPSTTAEHLTDPGFLDFVVDCKNSIFLLEDAEKIIRSREDSDNAAVSNILNITDGLLGDCLNIFVVATFNTSRDKVDKALLRKGRLLFEHHFEELTPDKCNKIFENLGSDRKTDIPMSLADIFNSEENYHKEEKKNKIGF
jgi:hypothetical protein